MKIDTFILENWLNPLANSGKWEIKLGSSNFPAMTVEEVFELTGESMDDFFEDLKKMSLGYGRFTGTPRLREAVAKLYKGASAEDVVLVHGGTGANNTVVFTLLETTDNVISIMPNYQQFDSLPKSMGVEVRQVKLKPEAGYRLIIDDVKKAVDQNTKAILFTNPNNPTGSVMTLDEMNELAEVARSVGAWIVCDEMYRGLADEYMPSFVDVYEKAIVTCSSSKIYSMAGTRVGWIVCKDAEMREELFNRRSYDSICGGVFDEWIFAIAMEHVDKIYERDRKIVKKNKAIIDRWLDGHPYLKQYADSYGTTYLVHYDLDIDSVQFCEDLLDQKRVLLCHGDCFYCPHTFRLSLSYADNLEEGLRRIDEFIDDLVKSGVKRLK